jgi:hypothetical protein
LDQAGHGLIFSPQRQGDKENRAVPQNNTQDLTRITLIAEDLLEYAEV